MAIVGMGITKINVEKLESAKGKVGIKNNISIKKVDLTDLNFGASAQKGLRFSFSYVSVYTPKIGEILIEGDIIDLIEEKKAKEIADEWKKSKKIPGIVMNRILNAVLEKCNIEALLLAREVNLPSPVPLPKVKLQEESGK